MRLVRGRDRLVGVDVAQDSRPCKGCGEPIYRMVAVAPIKHYHSPDCRPRCSVDGCESPRRGDTYCHAHRERWKRTGVSPTATGDRRQNAGTCSVDGCNEPMRKVGWCASHYAQWQRSGEDPKPFKYKWGSDDVGYIGVHHRLQSQRGSAADLICQHCGKQAAQWAYDHSSPAERTSGYGPFSVDLDRYIPLCCSCHKRFDLLR